MRATNPKVPLAWAILLMAMGQEYPQQDPLDEQEFIHCFSLVLNRRYTH